MSKKNNYWTYNLSKLKKLGSKLLNDDFEQFLLYSNNYQSWFNKTHTKKTYIASQKGFKNYGTIKWDTKGKNLLSSFDKAKFTSIKASGAKLGKISLTNIEAEISFYSEAFVSTSAKINKKLIGSKYADNITFGGGNDFLDGKKGNDELYGMEGNDILKGGSGNDLLEGGKGNDKIWGGKGKDIFKLSKGQGHDLIQDFKDKQDKISFGGFPTKYLKIKNKGKDAYIYYVGEGNNDLLAKVKGAKGKLQSKGKFLV